MAVFGLLLDGYSGELARELKYSIHGVREIVVSSAADLVVVFACVDFLSGLSYYVQRVYFLQFYVFFLRS